MRRSCPGWQPLAEVLLGVLSGVLVWVATHSALSLPTLCPPDPIIYLIFGMARYPSDLAGVLQRPLNVHALPQEILDGLTVRTSSVAPPHTQDDNDDDSSSGSSSSDIDEEDEDDNRKAPSSDDDDGSAAFYAAKFALRTPLIQFTPPPSLSPDTQLSVYRALFPATLDRPEAFLPYLRELQLTPEDLQAGDRERRWVLLMLAGGHFAGCVIALGGKREGKKAVKGQDGEIRVLKHKTFHRYTSEFVGFHQATPPSAAADNRASLCLSVRATARRKQGGSQSKNDNANGAANSIGAQMRRAGEAKLNDEVRELLESWQDDFNAAERVFIRGSVSAKKTFWGYDRAVIAKSGFLFCFAFCALALNGV